MKRSERTRDFLIEKVKHLHSEKPQVMHFHPYYEIGVLLGGERTMVINETLLRMKKGDVVFIDPNAVHKGSTADIEWVGIYVTKDFLESLIGECKIKSGIYYFAGSKQAYMRDIVERMLYEKEKADAYSASLIKSYFTEFLVMLLRSSAEEETASADSEVADILDYIFNNYRLNLSLDGLAKMYGLSNSSFSRKFKKSTGCGFKEYLTNIRLKHAYEMLLSTDLSVTQIADRCGFESANYFGDVFKKAKGVSPVKYRKNAGM